MRRQKRSRKWKTDWTFLKQVAERQTLIHFQREWNFELISFDWSLLLIDPWIVSATKQKLELINISDLNMNLLSAEGCLNVWKSSSVQTVTLEIMWTLMDALFLSLQIVFSFWWRLFGLKTVFEAEIVRLPALLLSFGMCKVETDWSWRLFSSASLAARSFRWENPPCFCRLEGPNLHSGRKTSSILSDGEKIQSSPDGFVLTGQTLYKKNVCNILC